MPEPGGKFAGLIEQVIPCGMEGMRPTIRTAIALLVTVLALPAEESWVSETLAGSGVQGFSGDGGAALEAKLDSPFGVVRGPDGALWFCEYKGNRVRRVSVDGIIETVAGSGQSGFSGDGGPALEASFNLPHEIRFDAAGNLYVVDMANHAVRRVDLATGVITTVAGTGQPGYSGDGGPATGAALKQPHSIQFGPDSHLYICDIGNHVIRRVDMESGEISTFAGTGKPGPTPDGSPIRGTPLNGPRSLDFDSAGNLWLATREGNQVFRFDLEKETIHHVAGTGKGGLSGDGGPAREATLRGPKGLAIDAEGNVWLADTDNECVRMIEAGSGIIRRIAGTGEKGDGPDGPAEACRLDWLHGISVDRDGGILVGDSGNHRIRVLRKQL
jgi:streptogramin lyase